jgi:hypothetical protein
MADGMEVSLVGDLPIGRQGVTPANPRHRLQMRHGAHLLRHSAAVWSAEDGVPMEEIVQYLDHSSTAVISPWLCPIFAGILAASSVNSPSARKQT